MSKRDRTITELREKSKRQEQIISIFAAILMRKGVKKLAGAIAWGYRDHVGERLPRVPQQMVDDYLAERKAYLVH